MHIHLPGRHYHVNFFHSQAFVSEQKVFQVCPYFVFSGLFLDDMVAASSASPGCFYRLVLHWDRLFLIYQQGFFRLAGHFRKIWVLSSPEFQVLLLGLSSYYSSSFWTHETWLVYNRFQTHSMQTIMA